MNTKKQVSSLVGKATSYCASRLDTGDGISDRYTYRIKYSGAKHEWESKLYAFISSGSIRWIRTGKSKNREEAVAGLKSAIAEYEKTGFLTINPKSW